MILDAEHGNEAYEDGEDWREASALAHIAYADWYESLAEAADHSRKVARENGITNPFVDAWVASQTGPLCTRTSGSFTCVLSAEHTGGCYMRATR